MKLNVKWFSITALIIGTVPALVLFVWCSLTGFGTDLVKLFESIHPSGGITIFSSGNFVLGILINTLYSAVDSFILGFAFSSLYNLFVTKFEK